jgi:hypothetical protein
MSAYPPAIADNACTTVCSASASAELLNRECVCLAVDQHRVRGELDRALHAAGVATDLVDSHPHLFAAVPVFVSPRHLELLAGVVRAVHEVSLTPAYRAAALAWAAPIAQHDPGSPGGLLGLDFHLGPDGPRLIEINTNPGGAMLNLLLGQALLCCTPDLILPATATHRIERALLDSIMEEWRAQRGQTPPKVIAIVDEAPEQQYLYPEFLLYQSLFRRHGFDARICAPQQLVRHDARLWLDDTPLDLIYNRLTDFTLDDSGNAAIRDSYLNAEVVLTPHPRAHALLADKRNLSLLCDQAFLRSTGIPEHTVAALLRAVPFTRLLTPDNRVAMWSSRRQWFFKPAAGYGSKASYRGDKLTHRVWAEMAEARYVAQQLVVPGARHLATHADPLKFDLRCYAHEGEVLLYAARVYQGQTTNFRTPGGGFAPVLSANTRAWRQRLSAAARAS